MEVIVSSDGGANVDAFLNFLIYGGLTLLSSFVLWFLIPAIIISTAFLILYNTWILTRPVIVPVAAVLWLGLNYAIRLAIIIGILYMLYRLILA